MDPRAVDILAWLDTHASDVLNHPGAAYAETEILRMLVTGTGPATGGILSEAYRRDFVAHGFPNCQNRAEARGMAHTVMFGSNFGTEAISLPEGAGDSLDELLLTYSDDIDTLGELLIACHILEHTSTEVVFYRAMFETAIEEIDLDFENYHVLVVAGILYAITSE